MRDLIRWWRWRRAWWKWFFEPIPVLDPNVRPFLPKDAAARRKTLQLLRERYRAREPKREDFGK